MARRLPRRPNPIWASVRGIGGIILVGAGTMVASAVTGLLYAEWWAVTWLALSAGVTAAAGLGLRQLGRIPTDFDVRDAMTTAGAGWLAIAIFGALPFLLSAHLTPETVIASYIPTGSDATTSSLLHFRDPVHALFESMSGWTTTGLTMSVAEPTLPHALLMYRSLMQWIGGAGIIVLALTVFHQHAGIQGFFLYQAETRQHRLRPSIVETARRVWRVYVVVTIALAVYLFAATLVVLPDYSTGKALFDAVNHAMTGQATGGFSTLDDSIAGYGSPAMEWIHLLPMVSGAIALPVHYLAIIDRKPLTYVRDLQNRAMFAALAVGSTVVTLGLVGVSGDTDPFRHGIFQFFSALTGTGWQTSAVSDWPAHAALIVVIGMIIGGAAGSTVGGIKLLRAIYLVRGAWWRIQQVSEPPSAVKVFRLGDRTLPRDAFEAEAGRAAGFLFLWLTGLAISVLLMSSVLEGEFTLANIIFEAASAQDTVGLSTGLTGPDMPRSVELTFILQMWLGRLEIIPVVVFVRALFNPRA